MIKYIIFDADGVLINSERFSVYLERDYGISIATTREFFTQILPDCVIGTKDLKEELPPYLQQWGWKKSVEDFIDYWHKVEHNLDQELLDYIKQLRKKGIICCLATNQTKYRFEYMLKEMGLQVSLDKVYASAHLGHRKPAKEFYEKVLSDLHVTDPTEVLFWDDSPENIAGAKEVGIHAELYTSFEDFKEKMKMYGVTV